MSKTRIVILIGLLFVIFAFASFLWIGTESRFGDFVFGNAVTPALLFFVFFGAVAGVLKIFVDAVLPRRKSETETSEWERTRSAGRVGFVLKALLFYGLPIIALLALQLARTDLTSYVVRNFVILGIVLIGGVAMTALSLWNYHEAVYLRTHKGASSATQEMESRNRAE